MSRFLTWDFDADIPEIQPNLPETEPTTSVRLTLPAIDLVMDIDSLTAVDNNQPPPVKQISLQVCGK